MPKKNYQANLQAQLQKAAPALFQLIIEKALRGDPFSAKLCLDRLGISFPKEASLLQQVQVLKDSVVRGCLPATEAGVLVRLIALESALTSAAEGGKGLSAEDVIRLLNSEVPGV